MLGVPQMDDDHKRILDLTHALFDVLVQRASEVVINSAVVELVNFTCAHFEREERCMIDQHYPEYAQHKDEHTKLTEEISKIITLVKQENSPTISEPLLNFMAEWIILHTKSADHKFARYLRATGGTFA
jgi:hemerythrin